MTTQLEPKQNGALKESAPALELSEVRYTPSLDIYETEEGLVLEADLPGVPPDQMEIRVKDNVLEILGRGRWPIPEQSRVLYEEVKQGDYYRSFILNDEVDVERITADFHHGVLRLNLPKAAKARPRKIEVRVSEK